MTEKELWDMYENGWRHGLYALQRRINYRLKKSNDEKEIETFELVNNLIVKIIEKYPYEAV